MYGEAALHIFLHIVGLYKVTLPINYGNNWNVVPLRVSRNIKTEQLVYENVVEIWLILLVGYGHYIF